MYAKVVNPTKEHQGGGDCAAKDFFIKKKNFRFKLLLQQKKSWLPAGASLYIGRGIALPQGWDI